MVLHPSVGAGVDPIRRPGFSHGWLGKRGQDHPGTPNGIRTRVTALKGRRPRPLDDGGQIGLGAARLPGRS